MPPSIMARWKSRKRPLLSMTVRSSACWIVRTIGSRSALTRAALAGCAATRCFCRRKVEFMKLEKSPFLLWLVLLGVFWVVACCEAASPRTQNLFLIITDGFRWQEVFNGAEENLMTQENGGVKDVEAFRAQFWRPTPESRREALLPF